MGARKHITDKTKLAALLVIWGRIPYEHAKLMTDDQVCSLVQWHHNILHSFKTEDRDHHSNLAPMWIREHREQTKIDRKVIDKSKRIREKWVDPKLARFYRDHDAAERTPTRGQGRAELRQSAYGVLAVAPRPARPKHKLQSRGFDKTRRRHMDGRVTKR